MLRIIQYDEIEQLREMSAYLEADFVQDIDAATLSFNNNHGHGYISTYQVFPGLTAKVYNVHLKSELHFETKEQGAAPIYFLYCLEGNMLHKFGSDDHFEKIDRRQNIILSGKKNDENVIILPANINLKVTILSVRKKGLQTTSLKKARRLERSIDELLTSFKFSTKRKYFGEIDTGTYKFAEALLNNKRVDLLGNLLAEGAILNTLGHQLLNHEKAIGGQNLSKLPKEELLRIIDLSEHIKNNLGDKISVKQLAGLAGLSAKNLQNAFKHLYGESVASFIQRLRLEHARQLLQSTTLSVSEICFSVGLSNRSYFSKLFQETFGVLPSEFKKFTESNNLYYELSYESNAAENISNENIETLIQNSLNANKENNITGVLLFHNGKFYQVIEGPKNSIIQLYDNIKNDPRHHKIRLLWRGFKAKRTFTKWSLAYLTDQEKPNYLNQKFNDNLNQVAIAPFLKDIGKHAIFTDILWRRILNLLNVEENSSYL